MVWQSTRGRPGLQLQHSTVENDIRIDIHTSVKLSTVGSHVRERDWRAPAGSGPVTSALERDAQNA